MGVYVNGAQLAAADFGFPLSSNDDPARALFLSGGGSNADYDNMQAEFAIRRASYNSAQTASGWTEWKMSSEVGSGFDASTSTWQCTNQVFSDPNPGRRKNCECEGAGVCAEEGGACVCSGRMRYGSSSPIDPGRGPGSAGGSDRARVARSPTNVAFPNPANFSRPLGRFDAANQYREHDDRSERLDGMPVGSHTFNAIAGSSTGTASGWHGGWWEIVDGSGTSVAGGQVDGLVAGSGSSIDFTVADPAPAECQCDSSCSNRAEGRSDGRRSRSYTLDNYMCTVVDQSQCGMNLDDRGRRVCEVDGLRLNIRTEWRAGDIFWTIDDGEAFQMDKAPVYIGGRGGLEDDNFFIGSIGGLSISTDPFSHKDINCMYLHGSQSMGHCDAPRGLAYSAPLFESVSSTPPKTVVSSEDNDVTLYGNAYLDRDFGAMLDGNNDFLTFEDKGYTSGDSFTIGFWFTRGNQCRNPGRWQFLFSEAADPEAAFTASDEAAIEVYLGCAESWRDDVGNIIRTYVQDTCSTVALFDIPLRQVQHGGPITSQWVHYLLSVSPNSIQTYLDGERVSDWDVMFKEDGFARNWIQSPRNVAWPRPSRLRDESGLGYVLCGFGVSSPDTPGLSEVYGSSGSNNIALDTLTDGTQYTLSWEAGAAGQFWVGSAAGRASCVDATCTFAAAVPAACTGADAAGNACVVRTWGAGCAEMPAAADGTPATADTCTFVDGLDATCGDAPCAINKGDLVQPTALTGQAGSVTFTAAAGTWLQIENGASQWDAAAQIASQMRWSINAAGLAGPATSTTFLGGRSDRADDHYFWGSMAELTVQTTDINEVEARCMFQSGEKQLGVCDNDEANLKIEMFTGRNMDSLPRWGTTMGGSAHTEDDYGVTLDGQNDYVKVDRPENDYANSGRFAISFWFTKAVCHAPGDYEILYSHHADDNGWSGCRHGADGKCSECNPGVQIYLGCFSDGADGYTATSTISGDVIRTMITDDDCRTAVWDSPLNNGAAGYVTDEWVHFALSVWGRGAHTYVDGESIDPDEVGYPIATGAAARWWGWATGPGNIAYNDLSFRGLRNFTEPLGAMTLFENPEANSELTRRVTLKAGTHTFTPQCGERPEFCEYSEGWGEGTYYTITRSVESGVRSMGAGPHRFFSDTDGDGVDDAAVVDYASASASATRTAAEAVDLCAAQCGTAETCLDDVSGTACAYTPGTAGAPSTDCPAGCTLTQANAYQYIGLQWTHECWCDNSYDEQRRVDDAACDADADGSPDCGQSDTGRVCDFITAVYDTNPPATCTGTNDGTIVVNCTGSDDGTGAGCALNATSTGCAVAGGECAFVAPGGAACTLDATASACSVAGGDCMYAPAPASLYTGCFADGPAVLAGGSTNGLVTSLTQDQFCSTGGIFTDETRCDASPCCYFSNSRGECRAENRDEGSRTCMMDPSSGGLFTLDEDDTVTVTVSVSYRARSPWAVNWIIDDGSDGMYGPLKGHVFLGAANEDTGGWNSNNGFMGSIAGLKTFSRQLRPAAAKCQFQDQERHLGICEGIGGVMFEAEFTSRVGVGDQERDLNGLITLDVDGVGACFEICKAEYTYFGLQWGSMCSCGNEVGQHGLAPVSTVAESCDTGGYIDDALQASCAAVPLGTATSASDCRAVASNYVGVAQKMTWADARAYCQAAGGDLASIHSDVGQLNAVAACADASPGMQCWIGLNDQAVEGTFVWSDGSAVDFDHFSAGQPDDWHPEDGGEDTVQLWQRPDQAAHVGSWNDQAETSVIAFVCETAVSTATSEAQTCVYTAPAVVDECTFDCSEIVDESCRATDEAVCRARDVIIDFASAVAETCLDAMGTACVFTPGTAGAPSTDCPNGCTLTPAVAAVDAATNQAACEAVGDCTYAPADATVVYTAAGCYSASADYCTQVDLSNPYASYSCSSEPNAERGRPGGCLYTPGNATDRTPESCSASVLQATCDGLADGLAAAAGTCGNTTGCEWRPARTQTQRCRATARDNCRAVTLPSDPATCEAVTGCSYVSATPADQLKCGGADRNSVYMVDVPIGTAASPAANYVGCFVDASSSQTYDLGGDATQQAAWADGGGFGLTFDGNGDFAELTAVPDYANDGTFSLSFWFTKTPCLDPDGPYQILYAHQGQNRTQRSDPRLIISVGCSSQGAHSTVDDGDIIRFIGTDDAAQNFVFDAPMKDAVGGGFVTSMWVHLVLAMDTDGARVFIDGRDITSDLGHPQPSRWIRYAQTRDNLAWPNPARFGEWIGRDMKGGAHGYIRQETCSNFVGVSQAMDWDDARAYCQATYPGGDLASIHDRDAQRDANTACQQSTNSLQCWIGLNDVATEGSFAWSDGSPIDYVHYSPGEPNDWRGGEDHVLLWHREDDPGWGLDFETWNDDDGTRAHSFICQTGTVVAGTCSYDRGDPSSCGTGCTYTGVEDPPTLAGALAECEAICRKDDDFAYKYMGLQWSNECFCGNSYGNRGQHDDESTCDVDGDGTIDCAQGIRIPSTDGGRDRTFCGGTNAVYSLYDGQDMADGTPSTKMMTSPNYIGCYKDDEEPTSGKAFAGMTFDPRTYTTGGGQDDAGVYTETVSLEAGHHAFRPMGSHNGWASGNYFELLDAAGASIIGGAPILESCVTTAGLEGTINCETGYVAGDATAQSTTCPNACTLTAAFESSYVGVQTEMTWADARAYCQASYAGGDLASIHDDQAQTNARDACMAVADDNSCWIGLNDVAVEGTFAWSDGSVADYAHWSPGEPNDWGAVGEDHVQLWHRRDTGDDETWNDADGTNTNSFVCQMATPAVGTELVVGGETCDVPSVTACANANIRTRSTTTSRTNCESAADVGVCTYTLASDCNPLDNGAPSTDANCEGSLRSEDKYIGFDLTQDTDVTVRISITSWGNAVNWQIVNQDLSWIRQADGSLLRREVQAFGPVRGHPFLGSAGPNAGWFSSQDYSGSIADIAVYWRPIDEEDVGCIYRKLENLLTTCVPPEEMRGAPYYSTMDPRDMNGDFVSMGNSATIEQCSLYCANFKYFGVEYGTECYCDNTYGSYGAGDSQCTDDPTGILATRNWDCPAFLAMQAERRSADGSFISGGDICAYEVASSPNWDTLRNLEVFRDLRNVFDQQGSTALSVACPVTCGTCGNYIATNEGAAYYSECNVPCAGDAGQTCGGGWRNSVYENGDGASTGDGTMEWSDWVPVAADGTISCTDANFGTSSSGVRAQCYCQGQGYCARERRTCQCINADGSTGLVRMGRPNYNYVGCFKDNGREISGTELVGDAYFDHDFGLTLDGDGDYAKIDMSDTGRWLANDGKFTLAVWATKTACTVPSWWESLIAYYKYPDASKWAPDNTHVHVQLGCASYTHSTIEGDLLRVDLLDDDGGRTVFDVDMNSPPGADNPVTDTWFHLVLSVSTEQIKVYIDGVDVCAGGSYGGDSGRCGRVGVPTRPAWTQTAANGAYPRLNTAKVSGFDMTYGVCPPVLECKDDRFGSLRENRMDCPSFIRLVTTSGLMPPGSTSSPCEFVLNSGMALKEVCPSMCTYDCPMPPPCDPTNMTDPSVTRNQSPLFLGGSSMRGGSSFTGSVNGLGIFRYPMNGDEANCLFRFGEYDIHVCQDPDDMFGLFHSMNFLPAAPDMEESFLGWDLCLIDTRSAADAATCWEDIPNNCGGSVCDGQGDGPCGCDPCTACPESNPATVSSCSAVTSLGDATACEATAGCVYKPPARMTCEGATSSPTGCMYVDADATTATAAQCNNPMGTAAGKAACAAQCRAAGFAFMGLAWDSACMCDNDYGSGGPAPIQDCDVDFDGEMDCGMFSAGWDWFMDPSGPCAYRLAVYDVSAGTGEVPIGCFRDPTGKPAGLSLGGDAYLDDSGRHSGTVGMGDEDTADDFGIHFDGLGDWASISDQNAGAFSDGTFSIAFWVSQPSCGAAGQEQLLYQHTARVPGRDPLIQITYVCANDPRHQHSTAQESWRNPGEYRQVDIMRATLTDDDGNTAVVDWATGDDGGLVTDSWMHVVLGVHLDGPHRDGQKIRRITVHMDGQKVRRLGYPVFSPAAMNGPSSWVRAPAGGSPAADCGTLCAGWDFVGISGSNRCTCGNSYDSAGPADNTTACGTVGELCGVQPCADFQVPGGCDAMMASIGVQMPNASATNTAQQLTWACTQDVHLHWSQAPLGTPYSSFCPVSCGPYVANACTPTPDHIAATIDAQCSGVNAVYEITRSGSLGPYQGCFKTDLGDNANIPGTYGRVVNWQSAANAAWPDPENSTLAGFNVDRTYGNGWDDVGDFYETVQVNTDRTQHTFHAHSEQGDWNGGFWEVLSADKDLCESSSVADCLGAGVCSLSPDVEESCLPTGHAPDECLERGSTDDDCCAEIASAGCTAGFDFFQQPPGVLDANGDDVNACATCSGCDNGVDRHSYPTYCAPPGLAATAFPACSFTTGDSSSCGAGCSYTAPTQTCGAQVLAGGCVPGSGRTPATGPGCVDQPDMLVDFVAGLNGTVGVPTGGGSCQVTEQADQFCHVNFDGTDAAVNQATCEAAGDCEYVAATAASSTESCQSRGTTLCAGAYTDQSSCEALYVFATGGSGCSYTALDSSIIVHINVRRWGNYVRWDIMDNTGQQEGRGPRSNPIYLGGKPGYQAGLGGFLGNIADLFIFSRNPDDEDIDCMYRNQQMALGKCRQPQNMWGAVFWNELTTPPSIIPTATCAAPVDIIRAPVADFVVVSATCRAPVVEMQFRQRGGISFGGDAGCEAVLEGFDSNGAAIPGLSPRVKTATCDSTDTAAAACDGANGIWDGVTFSNDPNACPTAACNHILEMTDGSVIEIASYTLTLRQQASNGAFTDGDTSPSCTVFFTPVTGSSGSYIFGDPEPVFVIEPVTITAQASSPACIPPAVDPCAWDGADPTTCPSGCEYTPKPFLTPAGRHVSIAGDATIVPGIGLDLTGNDRVRAMGGGTFTLMDGLSDDRGVLTPEACINKCGQDGYNFAGLQNGQECWCDNSYDSAGVYTPTADEVASGSDGCDAACTVNTGATSSRRCGGSTCAGDPSRTCGGGWRNSVYSTAGVSDCTGYVPGTYNAGVYAPSVTCPLGCTLTQPATQADGSVPVAHSCVAAPQVLDADNLITLDLASHPGVHVMVASATEATGWSGGWWEVTIDGTSICGGPTAGLITAAGDSFGVCTIPVGGAARSIVLNIRAGTDMTGATWHMDEHHTSDCVTNYQSGDAITCPAGCQHSTSVVGESCGQVLTAVPAGSYQGCYADHPSNSFALLNNIDESFAMSAHFSISFWFSRIYCTDEASTSPWQALFSTAGEHCDAAHADGCEPQEIGIFIRCNANTALSGVNGTVLRLILHDDAGQLVQTDLLLGEDDTADSQNGLLTQSWVHYALVVDGDTVGQFLDGSPVTTYGFGRFGNGVNNLAWHNASDTGIEQVSWDADGGKIQLRGAGLTSFNFTGPSHQMQLGFNFGPWGGEYFNGYMANVGLFRRAIDDSEISCMYKYGEAHLSLPANGR